MELPTTKVRKPPTMQDVADLVGVSKQTISAVINSKPGITAETSARVWTAIEQLGYRLDWNARSLRTGRTHTIALFVTDVSSPVPGMIARAAEDYAYAAHYNLILYSTHDDVEREQVYLNAALQRSVDGVLFMSAKDESDGPQALLAAGLPVVTIARRPKNFSGLSVTLDNLKTGRLAAEHLAGLGHCRIAHIAGPFDTHPAIDRLRGFREALHECGPDTPIVVTEARGWHVQAGYDAMKSLLASTPDLTAVFVAGDALAIGAMHAVFEAGLRVPEDISVVSVDDIDLAAYLNPPLTTVSMSIAHMATTGVQLLLDLIAGKEPPQMQTLIEPRLVVRRSTARLHAAF